MMWQPYLSAGMLPLVVVLALLALVGTGAVLIALVPRMLASAPDPARRLLVDRLARGEIGPEEYRLRVAEIDRAEHRHRPLYR